MTSKIDWFSKSVEFPKTGYQVNYGVYGNNDNSMSTDPFIYTDIEAINERAYVVMESCRENKQVIDENLFLIPMVFEGLLECQKIFWKPLSDPAEIVSNVLDLIYIQQSPEQMKALVSCSEYSHTKNHLFSPVAMYKTSETKKEIVERIRRSKFPADQQVSHFGIYQIVTPFMYKYKNIADLN